MLSLDLCDRAAAPQKPVVVAPSLADAATGSFAHGSYVEAATEASRADTHSRRNRGILWPWRLSTRRLVILAAIVLGIRIFVGEASVVPTASMEGTILVGDHLFMDKLLYGPEIDGRPPERSEEHTSELQSQSNLVCRL